jgi:RNA polymerase-binding transcription factor
MNHTHYEPHYDRLVKRRDEIIMTRKHLQSEQQAVDENKDWLDHAAYQSRVELLDSLTEWYLTEMAQINDALTRIAEGRYGICLACHEPIEPERLDLAPEALYCSSCQSAHEDLARV